MKKLFLILMLAIVAMAGMAHTIGDAFYIYRNDGQFNAFFRAEVDSIVYSNYDADSVYYDEIVTQLVYTQDSIYWIPLASVDSVGFVTPKTIYQPGVKLIEGELRSFITSRDEFTLTFKGNTPERILPKIGDVLVSTTGDKILESAFIGKVSEIESGEGIKVICTPVALTEAFETYYGYAENISETNARGMKKSIRDGVHECGFVFNPGRQSIDIINSHNFSVTYNKDDQLSFGIDNARLTLSLTPVIRYNAFTIINRKEIYTQVSIIGDYTIEEEMEMSGNFTFNTDFPFFKPKPIPIPEALLDITFEAGIFGKAQAQVSIEQHWTQKLKSIFFWNWSNHGDAPLKNTKDFRLVSNTHTGKVAINGGLGVGVYVQPGVSFIATSDLDIAEAGLRAEWGISLEGTYVPYKKDMESAKTSTDLYNQVKDKEIGVFGYRGLAIQTKLFKWSVSHEIPNDILPIPFNKKESWGGIRSVPLFSDSKLKRDQNGNYSATAKASGEVQSMNIGMALINDNDKSDAEYKYTIKDYKGPSADVNATFSNKSSEKRYTVYPLVNYMGMDMIAEPKAEMKETSCPDANHPHWIDLGLPSGTLWRCCNEGASTPEAYGGYYQFGQVSSAPTLEQIQELIDCCTYQWTTQNGVNGGKFTGPNGGTIFLPAAGLVYYGELYDIGSFGDYWSSTPRVESGAFGLSFNSDHSSWSISHGWDLSPGYSVRPVRKN